MGYIAKIAGPVIVAKDMAGTKMYDVVRVGKENLVGEVIRLTGSQAVIQVYEDTNGIKPNEPVESTRAPLVMELGPGLISSIYDGIGRPLPVLAKLSGDYISRGLQANSLDRKKTYDFIAEVKKGSVVKPGQILGTAKESELVNQKILVPPGIKGKITQLNEGKKTVEEPVIEIDNAPVSMMQRWPVRVPRPYVDKIDPNEPLISGQRVFDSLFPLAKGGTAAIPGPFGAGKTISQHQLARWSDAQIVVYIGCGERGNEMTEVLDEFPKLLDPKSGKPLMDRTVLIANTSNMPVAAREASVYTGVTIAEFFRDQGFNVALMADSTSRWAEAMREISSRLEEMPGEEGYPAYLSSRLSQFYERAGKVKTLNNDIGSVSIIGAVSPPGGDFSEPVTQNTLRITKVFWALEASLAYKRHFPSINWLTSYTMYTDKLADYFNKISEDFTKLRAEAMSILQKESELQEIVQLVGPDALPESDKLIMEVARSLREDFLQQNAFHDVDTYCPIDKQYLMLKTILSFYEAGKRSVEKGTFVEELRKMPFREKLSRMKYQKDYKQYIEELQAEMKKSMTEEDL